MTHASIPANSEKPRAQGELLSAVVHDLWGPDVRSIQRIAVVPQILKTVCMLTGMGFSTIARVTKDSWICCASHDEMGFGMRPGTELDLQSTLCKDICLTRQPVVIDEVAFDVSFANHPTPRMFRFQSNISVPIILKDDSIFGTLCAIDAQPKRVSNPEIVATFRLFADLIARELDLADAMAAQESAHPDSAPRDLRDQFITVIGESLLDPVQSLAADVRLLADQSLSEHAMPIVDSIQAEVGSISRRIDDVLDFTRGRLGGGYGLKREFADSLESELEQVIAEYRASSRSRIETRFDLREPVNCDSRRIGQVLSNLLNTALAYGAATMPIVVEAATIGEEFVMSVRNAGEPIASETLAQLLQPYRRPAATDAKSQLVGLGLYIAAEIARAHGGEITVESTGNETCFTLTMPIWLNRPADA